MKNNKVGTFESVDSDMKYPTRWMTEIFDYTCGKLCDSVARHRATNEKPVVLLHHNFW